MRRKCGVLAAVLAAFALAGPASAGASEWYWLGYDASVSASSVFGARHTLNGNAGQWSVCVNALNDTGTSWVGSTVCGYLPSVNYCACALRYPWVGSSDGSAILMRGYSGWSLRGPGTGHATRRAPAPAAVGVGRPASVRSVAKSPIAAVSDAQRAAVPALSGPAASDVPQSLRQFTTSQNSLKFSPNPDLARKVSVAGDGNTWYVIPGNDSVCLFETADNAGTCASLDDAKAGRLFLQLVRPPAKIDPTWLPGPGETSHAASGGGIPAEGQPVQSTIVGLAPAGTNVVAQTLAGSSSRTTVADGLYSVTGTDVTGVDVVGATTTALSGIATPR